MEKYLCIDIGGTFIKYALLDKAGQITGKSKVASPATIDAFQKVLFEIVEGYPTINGIAISCPGKVDTKAGVIYHGGKLQYLHQLGIKKLLEEKFRLPVSVINDGRAAVLAERWLGNLQDSQNGCAIVLGSAIGGGILLEGNLLMGEHFQAGELSFMPYLQFAGNDFQMENIGNQLSAVRFINEACEELGLGGNDGEGVFDEVEKNNPQAILLLKTYCEKIAFYILAVQAVLDLKAIVIGGGISRQHSLIAGIQEAVIKASNEIPGYARTLKTPEIRACKFENDANLIGALYQHLRDKGI